MLLNILAEFQVGYSGECVLLLHWLKTRGFASPFRVCLSGEEDFVCFWFSHDQIACLHFLGVVIVISRPGSIFSGPLACRWASICATVTLYSIIISLFLDLPLASQEMHTVGIVIVHNVTLYYTVTD